jgi:hypothetical protein
MKEPTDCTMLGKKNLGDPNCQHQWSWSGEIITTAPAMQHRRCTLCGRKECVSICKSETRLEDCRDPNCSGHWDRNVVAAEPKQPKSGLILKNGILRYR